MKVSNLDFCTWFSEHILDDQDSCNIKKVCIALALYFGCKWLLNKVWAWRNSRRLAVRRGRRRQECHRALAKLRDQLPADQEALRRYAEILKLPLVELLEQLKDDKYRPVDVLEAYQYAATEANQKADCLIEPIVEATAWSIQLQFQSTRGLLYGLPIAIQENHSIKGYHSTHGVSRLIGKPSNDDCALLKALKAEGAIPFVRTNVSDNLCSFVTSNSIFGSTVNSSDMKRPTGGYSGGTATLLAAGGALIGTGSVCDGSIGNPAAFSGLFSFKGSPLRIGNKGINPLYVIGSATMPEHGPLSKSMEGLLLFMRSTWSRLLFDEDPTLLPIPFQEDVFSSKLPLRIGYFVDNGVFHCDPACKRAVCDAVAALERAGHVVTAFKPPNLIELLRHYFICTGVGGQGPVIEALDDDEDNTLTFAPTTSDLSLPSLVWKLMAILTTPFSDTISEYFWYVHESRCVSNWWIARADRKRLCTEFFDEWKRHNIDGIVCPAFGVPALPGDHSIAMNAVGTYAALFSVLNCPAGVVPVTMVTEEEKNNLKHFPDLDQAHVTAKQDLTDSVKLRVGVQCASLPYRDEVCLRMMQDLHQHLT